MRFKSLRKQSESSKILSWVIMYNIKRTCQDNFAPRNSPLFCSKLEQILHKQQEQHS